MTLIKKESCVIQNLEMTTGLDLGERKMWYGDTKVKGQGEGLGGGWGQEGAEGPPWGYPSRPDTKYVSTDDESTARCITNISSASSSISWAEDAVEAELTQKIFLLWEDIQEVCMGTCTVKPDDMTPTVFRECLKWKRAFPSQDLSRFTRFSETEVFPIPLPLEVHQDKLSPRSLDVYESASPDESFSSQSNCSTPNPEKSSLFVTSWLADCQNSQSEMERNRKDDHENMNHGTSVHSSHLSMPTAQVNWNPSQNHYEDLESDEYSYPEIPKADLRDAHRNSVQLRVQRPISSRYKGNLLTPLPTENTYARILREGPNRSSPKFESGTFFDYSVPESSNGRIPKGKTAPVHSVCPPHDIPGSKASSSGPRRAYSKIQNGDMRDIYRNGSRRGNPPVQYEDKYEGAGVQSYSGSRMSTSESFQNMGNIASGTTKVIKNSFSSGFLPSAGQVKTKSWSRHSASIQESYSFMAHGLDSAGGDGKAELHGSANANFQDTIPHPGYQSHEPTNPSNKLQPVRPFLYWLLDKVSPT